MLVVQCTSQVRRHSVLSVFLRLVFREVNRSRKARQDPPFMQTPRPCHAYRSKI